MESIQVQILHLPLAPSLSIAPMARLLLPSGPFPLALSITEEVEKEARRLEQGKKVGTKELPLARRLEQGEKVMTKELPLARRLDRRPVIWNVSEVVYKEFLNKSKYILRSQSI